jgi:hypothetical protein
MLRDILFFYFPFAPTTVTERWMRLQGLEIPLPFHTILAGRPTQTHPLTFTSFFFFLVFDCTITLRSWPRFFLLTCI